MSSAQAQASHHSYSHSHSSSQSQMEGFGVSASSSAASSAVSSPGETKLDRNSHLECVDYVDEIVYNLQKIESRLMPPEDYMSRTQRNLNHRVRTRVVDWLIDIAEEHNLDPETLYLTINYFDRFLSNVSVKRTKIQLISVACMFIASKYEELYPPSIDKFIDSSDDAFTKRQIVEAEELILNTLNFNLTAVTPTAFLNRLTAFSKTDDKPKHFAQYAIELLLQEPEYLKYKPSMIAAAGLCLAMYILDQTRIPWTPELQRASGYSLKELRKCIEVMFELMKKVSDNGDDTVKAVREKYSRKTYHRVSCLKLPSSLC